MARLTHARARPMPARAASARRSLVASGSPVSTACEGAAAARLVPAADRIAGVGHAYGQAHRLRTHVQLLGNDRRERL